MHRRTFIHPHNSIKYEIKGPSLRSIREALTLRGITAERGWVETTPVR